MHRLFTGGVCSLALIPALSARAGEVPGPVSPVGELRETFEYVERLEISRGGTRLVAASNAVVVVTRSRDALVVELHPFPGRPRTKPDDPTPGRISIATGATGEAGEPVEVEFQPFRVELRFAPEAAGLPSVKGVPWELANEVRAVLGQGPPANVLESGGAATYEIGLRSSGKPVVLLGEQRNGELWVDWTLAGSGALEVGQRGWELPVKFVLPSQEPRPGLTLSAEAAMRYSSVRAGPENETTVDVSIEVRRRRKGPGRRTASAGAERSYRRTCELRPIVLPATEVAPPSAKKLPVKSRLGGRAGDWARTATLATLGVQRLPGVRETGVAMWVAQAGIDCLAGPVVRKMTDKAARKLLQDIARRSPKLSPPPGFSDRSPRGFRPAGRWAARLLYLPSGTAHAEFQPAGPSAGGITESGFTGELSHGWVLGRAILHADFGHGEVDTPDEKTGELSSREWTSLGFRISAPSGWRFQVHLAGGVIQAAMTDPVQADGYGMYQGVGLSYAVNRRFSLQVQFTGYKWSGRYSYPTEGLINDWGDVLGLGLSIHF